MCHANAIDRRGVGKRLCLEAFSAGRRVLDRVAASGAQTHTTRTFVSGLAVLVDARCVAKWDAAAVAGLRVLFGNCRSFVSSMLYFVRPLRGPARGLRCRACELPEITGRSRHTAWPLRTEQQLPP